MSAGRRTELDHPLQGVAGELASSVVDELYRPLRQLRESLAVMVETVERYIADAEGPAPYPWRSLQVLRQELADAYLLSRETARVTSELRDAMALGADADDTVDANHQVEIALELLRHRFPRETEIFVDLGSVPPVRAMAGELVLVTAKMLLSCADSAHRMEGSAVSVQTRHEDDGERGVVVIYVADNGGGAPFAADSAWRSVAPVIERLGGHFEAVSEPGRGSVYECRLPVHAPGRSA